MCDKTGQETCNLLRSPFDGLPLINTKLFECAEQEAKRKGRPSKRKKNGADQKMPGLKFGKNTPKMHQTLAAV